MISHESLSLLPGKSTNIKIDFDPGFKADRVSGIINGKINITHA